MWMMAVSEARIPSLSILVLVMPAYGRTREKKRHLSKCFLDSSKKQTRISAAPLASMGKTMRDLLRWGLSDLTVLARRQIQSA